MKVSKNTLLIVLVLIWSDCFSQSDNQDQFLHPVLPSESQYFKITPKANPVKHSLLFKNILIIDSRLDNSSKIGYYNHRKENKSKKISLLDDLTNVFSGFANSYFNLNDTSTSGIIYAYIKNFRINVVNSVDSLNMKSGYVVSLKVEFYLRKESCNFPLYRFDSTGSGMIDFPDDVNEILGKWIKASFEKLTLPVTFNLQKRSCLSIHQIDSFNLVGRNYPILKTNQYNKGIFMTIDEFRQNKPSISEFKINRSKYYDFIYVKTKEKEDSVISDAFGYSDGKYIYIRFGYSFFTLFKSGDGFEFHGFDKETVDALNKKFGGGSINPMNSNRPTISFNDAMQRGLRGFLGLPDKKQTLQVWHLFDVTTGDIY